MRRYGLQLLAMVVLTALATAYAPGADWPTYAHDNARSAVTEEELAFPLSEQWVHTARSAPIPAWPDPQDVAIEGQLEEPRARFDDAYHVAVAGGALYFGTSCDNQVYCLDAASGAERWRFFTEGAIRLAPTVAEGRVYVASDDGLVYCVDAADGTLIWRFAAAPTRERVLARGKMTALHPPRTGVLVDGGVAYCSAGVFPGERVYLYAVNADDGSLIWRNDTISDGSAGQNGFSPQGYLLAAENILYVPSGRVLPAAFEKATGKFLFQRSYGWRDLGQVGGTYALVVGGRLYTGAGQVLEYDSKSGNVGFATFPGKRLIVTEQVSYMLGNEGLSALNRQDYPPLSKKKRDLKARRTSLTSAKPPDLDEQLKKLDEEEAANNEALAKCNLWKTEAKDLHCMILAGATLIAGGEAEVIAVEAATGEVKWRGEVKGPANGLAVADGRLFVSTEAGTIHCFGTGAPPRGAPAALRPGYAEDELSPVFERAARAIARDTGIEAGYCLVLGCGTGRLALELAKRTDLTVYGIDPDPRKVAAARGRLDAEGLYGTRACVDQGDLSSLPYADYFANLIVSEDALIDGSLPVSPEEALRVLKPIGGTIYVGQPAGPGGGLKPLRREALERWLAKVGDGGKVSTDAGLWGKYVRGPLEGAGSWTHQYADPGNSAASTDTAVKAPLGVLWYGEPGAEDAVNRHAGTAAPLSIDGRVYFQGVKEIICFDAYNGVQYWRREVPGAYRVGMVRECGNLACNEDGLFVSTGKECLLLDRDTGETVMTYPLPASEDGKARTWAYVALVGDTLYGSASAKAQESDAVFAVDIATGQVKWTHLGTSIRNNTLAISGGRMFFADNAATSQQRQDVLRPKIDELKERKKVTDEEAEKELVSADVRVAVCLDASTGDLIWQKPLDLTDCGETVLSLIAAEDVVLFCGAHSNGHLWPQFLKGEYAQRRITAVAAADGTQLWTKAIGYRIRPLVIGDVIYAEPWAFDLHTGEQVMRSNPVTGRSAIWQMERPGHHCGTISGCPTLLAFRSGSTAYYDLLGDFGVNHFAGQRAGCWINLIPANGLLLAPEASSGCVCLYAITCTVVFKPRAESKAWGIFSAPGETKPVRQLNVNLGAPGDRRGTDGKLWLGYPRPWGRMNLKFDLQVSNLAGGGFFSEALERVSVEGTEDPWLFASGCKSLTRCKVPLIDEGDGAAEYRVRLGFADLDNRRPGERVFDIKLQGNVVAQGFDPVAEAGAANRAVFKEFGGIRVDDDLVVELVPKATNPPPEQAPILNTVEVERTRVLHVGVTALAFLLSDTTPEDAGEITVTNLRDEGFEGKLVLTAPEGFAVTPAKTEVKLGADSAMAVPVKLTVEREGEPREVALDVSLVRADGAVENARQGRIEYLGPRARVVLTPAEDSYVNFGQSTANYGTTATLLVDGGDQAMGDRSHNISYLEFNVDIPGKSVSVKFRIRTTASPASESGNSGEIRLCEEPWEENKITYAQRPQPGEVVGTLGKVGNDVWEERDLALELAGKRTITLVLVPTSTDGASYHPREGPYPPELVIEYEPE